MTPRTAADTAEGANDSFLSHFVDSAYKQFDLAVNAGGAVDLIAELKKLWPKGPVVFGTGSRFDDLEIPPVFRVEGQRTALVMDYSGVTQVLREDGFRHAFYPEGAGDSLIHLNGEPHRRFRQMLAAAFGPKPVRDWETHLVPAILKNLLAKLEGQDRADILPIFIRPYPAMVFRAVMGLPEEDTDRVRALAILQIAAGADPRLNNYIAEMSTYFQSFIDAKRALSPQQLGREKDLISLLVGARGEQDSQLTDREILATLQLVVSAGVDTTNHGLANTLFMLVTHPEAMAEVKANRDLVPAAIEEALRLIPSGGNFEVRQATRDLTVSGADIARDMPVITCETTANRDPSFWGKNADTYDIHRERRQHLSFAMGPHTCLGMHLARMEIRNAINALFDRYPNLRLDTAQPTPEIRGFLFQAPTALPLILN